MRHAADRMQILRINTRLHVQFQLIHTLVPHYPVPTPPTLASLRPSLFALNQQLAVICPFAFNEFRTFAMNTALYRNLQGVAVGELTLW